MPNPVAQMFADREAARAAEPAPPASVPAPAPPDGEAAKGLADKPDGEPVKVTEPVKAAEPAKVEEPGQEDITDAELDALTESRLVRRLRRQLATNKESTTKIGAHEAEILRLKGLLEQAGRERERPKDWLDEFRPKAAPATGEGKDGLAALQARVDEMGTQQSVREAAGLLERELAEVAKDHPDVPRDLLLRAVELDGAADLHRTAEEYTAFVTSLRGKPDTKPEPDRPTAAKRPPDGRASSGAQAPSTKDIYAGARTVADLFARRAASTASA